MVRSPRPSAQVSNIIFLSLASCLYKVVLIQFTVFDLKSVDLLSATLLVALASLMMYSDVR